MALLLMIKMKILYSKIVVFVKYDVMWLGKKAANQLQTKQSDSIGCTV